MRMAETEYVCTYTMRNLHQVRNREASEKFENLEVIPDIFCFWVPPRLRRATDPRTPAWFPFFVPESDPSADILSNAAWKESGRFKSPEEIMANAHVGIYADARGAPR